jgi:hypothetical protein
LENGGDIEIIPFPVPGRFQIRSGRSQLAGCETVFSQDMQDGQVIEGLTIRNPFARAPQ